MESTAEGIWSPLVFASGMKRPVAAAPSMTAIQSLLAFGAILPPLTPWDGVSRLDQSDNYVAALRATAHACATHNATPTSDDHLRLTACDLLDDELTRALASGRRPLVMFSGGVDSALIAARLKSLGRDDMVLVHYQFSPNDPETPIALRLATELCLDLNIITRDDSGLSLLDQPGHLYPVPFGDLSALPTFELCRGLGRLVEPHEFVVFDGSGADAAFGLGAKLTRLRKLAGLPRAVRAVGSSAYGLGGWQLSGTPEYILRLARRASRLSPAVMTLAQNSLFEILYSAPDLPSIDHGWGKMLERVSASELAERVVISNLAVTEAGIFAQKSLGPLRAQGFEVTYPFLTSALARLGIRHTTAFPGAEPKAWMKEQLSDHVSAELVYRPKRGFVEPEMTVFDSLDFRDRLEAVLEEGDSPAHQLIEVDAIRRMIGRSERVGALPVGTLNFIWSLLFISRWYATAADGSSGHPPMPAEGPLL